MKCKFAAAATLLLMALSTLGWSQDDGAAIYKAKCASCHGAEGLGKPPHYPPLVSARQANELRAATLN